MKAKSIREVATLRDSERVQHIMREIDRYSLLRRADHLQNSAAGEFDPEYQLIVEANNLAVDVESEIGK